MKIKIFIIFLFAAAAIFSQDWKFSGQIQARTEVDGRDFSNSTYALTFASLRTRLGVEKTIFDKVTFFAQIQDSRIFGQEMNTLASIDNIDLHQGYARLDDLFEIPWSLQVGRFEVSYGTERFIGAVGWNYIGRSFDGARLKIKSIDLDLFALTHSDTVKYISNAVPSLYAGEFRTSNTYSIYGLWKKQVFNPQHALDIFGYYEINRNKSNGVDPDIRRGTVGLSYYHTGYIVSSIIEGAYQFGKLGTIDHNAYLISAQLNTTFKPIITGIGIDIVSGTKPGSDKSKSFSQTFGTNHKFYGYMDYFINIPANTGGLGLNDFYYNLSYQATESLFAQFMIHHFMANQKVLSGESIYGQEIDLTVRYDFVKGTAISWGGSIFIPRNLMKANFSTPFVAKEDTGFWTYLMLTANF